MEILLKTHEQLRNAIDMKGEQNIIGKRSVNINLREGMFPLGSCKVCFGQKSLTDRLRNYSTKSINGTTYTI